MASEADQPREWVISHCWCSAGEGMEWLPRAPGRCGWECRCGCPCKLWFPFSFLVIPSTRDQNHLPASQSPVRMRRNSFTPRASADTVKRPRHYSVGSKPLDLVGPFPSLEARDGADQQQLQVGVQVVPSLCFPSPPSPTALSGPL